MNFNEAGAQENWRQLKLTTNDVLTHELDRVRYLDLLASLQDDVTDQGKLLLGFTRAPAAKANHHAREGGLVIHLREMWDLWTRLRNQFTCQPYVTDQRVLKAIVLHDLHKAHRTFELLGTDPWSTQYCDDKTDLLMTQDVKSLWLANQAGISLDPEQINALLWAEGGFSKIKPRWCSVLAKICYALDELSGNGLDRIRTGSLLDRSRSEPERSASSEPTTPEQPSPPAV
jgi:hypothetical protein